MDDSLNLYLDKREKMLLENLTKEYEKFIKPGPIQTQIIKVQGKVSELMPEKIKEISSDIIEKANDWTVIKKVIEKAGKGFFIVQENSSRVTLDNNKIVNILNKNQNSHIYDFSEICKLRSYNIEGIVLNRRRIVDLSTAFVGGGGTGLFGLIGVPFNLAYTFFMYFRSVQSIGMYYGYDVVNDPRELAFASSVTMTCLSPHLAADVKNMGTIIGRMMLAANLSSLKESLSKLTYTQMAQKGGAELLYVQIRAMANATAKKALAKAGKEGIEAGMFKNLLEQFGKVMTKQTGKKAVPIIGAIMGALLDTYTMNNVINGANLIYHKRFLFEKELRIDLLDGKINEQEIIENEEKFESYIEETGQLVGGMVISDFQKLNEIFIEVSIMGKLSNYTIDPISLTRIITISDSKNNVKAEINKDIDIPLLRIGKEYIFEGFLNDEKITISKITPNY